MMYLPREVIVAAYCKIYGYAKLEDHDLTKEQFADKKMHEAMAEHAVKTVLKAIQGN